MVQVESHYGTWWQPLEEGSSTASMDNKLKYGRRSHSSVMYWNGTREFMIWTGGINDYKNHNNNNNNTDDFPMWSLDISCSTEYTKSQLQSTNNNNQHLPVATRNNNNYNCSYSHPTASFWKELRSKNKPSARMGHVSFLSNHCLYVFGGLLLPPSTFHLNEENNVDNPYEYDMDDPTLRRNELLITEEQLVLYQYNLTQQQQQQQALSWKSIPLRMSCPAQKFKSCGECQGGFWKEKNAMIIYGGLHKATSTTYQLLGDVWMIHLDTFTVEQLFKFPTFPSYDAYYDYPVARTAHAATIIGDELIIHGGMTKKTTTPNEQQQEEWYVLYDVWIFNLQTRKWRQKHTFPNIARSYHTMVSSSNKFVIFGGFRTSLLSLQNYEPSIAYVFADTFVGTISNNNDKQTYTTTTTNDTTSSSIISEFMNGQWLEAHHPMKSTSHNMATSINMQDDNHQYHTIHSRLEHTAVIDRFGTMYVWGGRFRTIFHDDGVWSLDVMNTVQFKPASMDELDILEAELQSLHIIIASLFVFFIFIFLFFSVLNPSQRRYIRPHFRERRNGRGDEHRHDNYLGQRSSPHDGVSQTIIDSLPLGKYKDVQKDTTQDCAVESCAICLIDYELEKDDDIRILPCQHFFHKDCIDTWLQSHVSCPTCRFHIGNSDNTSDSNNHSSSTQDQQQQRNDSPSTTNTNTQGTSTDAISRPFRWNSWNFVPQLFGISSYVTIHTNVDDDELANHVTELTRIDAELT